MEQLTTLVAALCTGAAAAAQATASEAVKDAYAGIKALLFRKYSKVAPALSAVEAEPNDPPTRDFLAKKLASEKAHEDTELLSNAQRLIESAQGDSPESRRHVQNLIDQIHAEIVVIVENNSGVIYAGRGSGSTSGGKNDPKGQ